MDFDLYRLSLESIQEQESDTVLLYHFRDWPRHAVPNNGLRGITNMYQEVMRSNINQQPTIDTVRAKFKLFMYVYRILLKILISPSNYSAPFTE